MPPRYMPPRKYLPAAVSLHSLANAPIPLKAPGCDWITTESIEECLHSGHLEDVGRPQTKRSHHAARIASLIALIRSGAVLDPIHLHIDSQISIYDGSHRVRAYQYTGRTNGIPAKITGDIYALSKFAVVLI